MECKYDAYFMSVFLNPYSKFPPLISHYINIYRLSLLWSISSSERSVHLKFINSSRFIILNVTILSRVTRIAELIVLGKIISWIFTISVVVNFSTPTKFSLFLAFQHLSACMNWIRLEGKGIYFQILGWDLVYLWEFSLPVLNTGLHYPRDVL